LRVQHGLDICPCRVSSPSLCLPRNNHICLLLACSRVRGPCVRSRFALIGGVENVRCHLQSVFVLGEKLSFEAWYRAAQGQSERSSEDSECDRGHVTYYLLTRHLKLQNIHAYIKRGLSYSSSTSHSIMRNLQYDVLIQFIPLTSLPRFAVAPLRFRHLYLPPALHACLPILLLVPHLSARPFPAPQRPAYQERDPLLCQ